MAVIKVNLTDTINGFRLKTNQIAENLGDIALLDTSGADSSVVSGINALDSDLGRQAHLNYRESADSAGVPVFLTIVDAINRIVDSAGDIRSNVFDSDVIKNHMLDDDIIDSSHIIDSSITGAMIQIGAVDSDNIADSAIYGAKFDAMTVFKIFNSSGTELRKMYAPARFDKDSADTFKTNPWV